MKPVKGDILNAEHGVICHQVNCRMVMGSGLARAIRDKYPVVYDEYIRVMTPVKPAHRLGKCQIVAVNPGILYVANLFGQFNYGRDKSIVYTDYNALAAALRSLSVWHSQNCHPKFPVYFPRGLGCGLANGNWATVEGIIRDTIPNAVIVRKV